MKKAVFVFFVFIILLFTTANAFAVGGPGQWWKPMTCVPSVCGVGHTSDRHMFRWKIICTGGNETTSLEIMSLMPFDLRQEVMRSAWMVMDVTSTDTWDDFTISFANAQNQTVFSRTLPADTDVTGIDLSEDWNQYLPAHEFVYLTIGENIWYGTVTIYIEGWIPEGR